MSFRDILEPEQVTILAGVLDDVCLAAGIQQNTPEHEDMAALIMHFYGRGYHTADNLKAALDDAMRQERYG